MTYKFLHKDNYSMNNQIEQMLSPIFREIKKIDKNKQREHG